MPFWIQKFDSNMSICQLLKKWKGTSWMCMKNTSCQMLSPELMDVIFRFVKSPGKYIKNTEKIGCIKKSKFKVYIFKKLGLQIMWLGENYQK